MITTLNRLIIKLIKKNIRIPSGSQKRKESPLFPFLFLSFSNFSLIFLYVLKKWFIFAPNIRHNLIVETMVILVIKKDEKS